MVKFKIREREPPKKNNKRSLGGKCQLKATNAAADTSEKGQMSKIELSQVFLKMSCVNLIARREQL